MRSFAVMHVQALIRQHQLLKDTPVETAASTFQVTPEELSILKLYACPNGPVQFTSNDAGELCGLRFVVVGNADIHHA